MDPFSLLLAVAPSAAKGIGSIAGKQVAGYLSKRTQRLRVARAVFKLATVEGITVSWRQLNVWLKADDVRLGIAAGAQVVIALDVACTSSPPFVVVLASTDPLGAKECR